MHGEQNIKKEEDFAYRRTKFQFFMPTLFCLPETKEKQ